jgi:hypothetical protein
MIHTQENIVFVCLFIGFYGLVGIVRDVLKAAGLIDTRAIITITDCLCVIPDYNCL